MSRPALQRVCRSLLTGEPAPAWTAAAGRIETERRAVETYLGSEGAHAYGFTTLLGHLDDQRMTPEDQLPVLATHLVEPSWPAPPELRTLLRACKLEQLHHGGSGIHPASYRALLTAGHSSEPVRGAWTTSYGSGDVVPAAWFVQDLRAGGASELLRHRGDLIALLNGHFVSTALALTAGAGLVEQAGRLLDAWLPYCARPLDEAPAPLRDAVERIPPHRQAPGPQAPVSLRDPRPVLEAVAASVERLGTSVERRLQGPSSNPMWSFAGDGARPLSQSSFLDFQLSLDLAGAIELAGLLAGLWQRLVEHVCAALEEQDPAGAPVQAPKAAQAIVEQVVGASAAPRRYTGQDSQGVEDLRDMSLQLAATLHGHVGRLGALEQVWRQLTGRSAAEPGTKAKAGANTEADAGTTQLSDALRELFLGAPGYGSGEHHELSTLLARAATALDSYRPLRS